MTEKKKIEAIDINIPTDEVPSNGIAYYRLTPHLRDFLKKCQDKHGIIGFEYEPGSWNFGVILGTKEVKGEPEQNGHSKEPVSG